LTSSKLRTPGNTFLVNLAVSDMLLVSLAAPATLTQLLTTAWVLPTGIIGRFLCTMTGVLPVLFSFVSSFTIICISLDRHRLIVHSNNGKRKILRTRVAVGLCWVGGLLMALPLLLTMELRTHHIQFGPTSVFSRSYCIESWPQSLPEARLSYSLVILGLQLILPSLVISLAHMSINRRLSRLATTHNRPVRKLYKTQRLLVAVVLVFTISWLPLNLINVLLDLGVDQKLGFSLGDVASRGVFAGAHLFALSSSVSNPVIYGFFNSSFRTQFKRLTEGRKSQGTIELATWGWVRGSTFKRKVRGALKEDFPEELEP